MSPSIPSRRAVVATLMCVLAGGGAASASAGEPAGLRLTDRAGDANAVNDQGEGLVGGVSTAWQVDQADLRTVAARSVGAGTRRALRVSFTTTVRPAAMADGTALGYGVVLEPRRDCRVIVEHVSAGRSATGTASAATGLLTQTCDGGHVTSTELPVHVTGRTARVQVPHHLLPAEARTAPTGATAYVRTRPLHGSGARPVELDGIR